MEITIQTEDTDIDPNVVNEIVNLARNEEADLYKDLKRAWALYCLSVVELNNIEQGNPMPTWAIHSAMNKNGYSPFGNDMGLQRDEVESTLEGLSERGVLNKTEKESRHNDMWEVGEIHADGTIYIALGN